MPGIFGIISKHSSGNETKQLEAMRDILLYEQNYTSALYANEDLGFFAGGTAIQDSFADCMPVYNEKKDLILFFSGECYFDKGAASDLKEKGHNFNPADGSLLIHLYEEQGDGFFENLNGWFSGIIIDLRQKKAFLFNDRYGTHRINYFEDKKAFYFASEAKALLKVLPALRNLDFNSAAEYYTFDCVLDNKTYFSDMLLIPPASVWSFSKGPVQRKNYFNPQSWEAQSILEYDPFINELKETFESILPRYFTDDSAGMSLTGGLDTRMILACKNPEAGKLPCYTFGGMYRDSFDVRISRRVAETCNQDHQILRVDEHFLNDFPLHAGNTIFVTDGLADVGKSHGIYLNKKAQQIAPVRMTGKLGSQVMRAATLLRDRSPNNEIFNSGFRENLSLAKDKFKSIDANNKLSFVLFKEIPWWWAGFLKIEVSQVSVRTPFLDNDLVKLLYRAPEGIFDSPEMQMDIISKYNPQLLSIYTNWGLGGKSSAFISKIRHQAYKFLNNSDKFYNWEHMPHWMARIDHKLAPLHMEKLVLGFDQYNHYRTWFRDELSGYLKEILLDDRALNRPYINKTFLRKIVTDHTKGNGNYLDEIKKILTLELINRVLIEDI